MGFSAAVGMVPDIGEGLGSLQLSPFISRYGALLLKYSRDVEREDGSLTVNGIEQKAVCLTVTYNTDQIRGLIRSALRRQRPTRRSRSSSHLLEFGFQATAERARSFTASLWPILTRWRRRLTTP